MSIDYADPHSPPHRLTNATVLQIVPALREDLARAAVNVAYVLIEAGARAIIASEPGMMLREFQGYGGEWIQLASETYNPFRIHANARKIEHLIASERIDIVHAYGPGAAWSARAAAAHMAVWFVTSIPDAPSLKRGPRGFYLGALAKGDRVIAPSIYAAGAMIRRYHIEPDRVTVVPRAIDTAAFNPSAMTRERITAVRDAWRVAPGERVVLAPGRVAPWNGQHLIPEAARRLIQDGLRGTVFVIAGDDRSQPGYVKSLRQRARELGVETAIRITGHTPDMPAAMAAADVVAVPAIAPPILGRLVAEAQAMGKPVVTSAVGTLPENVVTPPRIAADLRTGWVVKANDAAELARALAFPLALDYTSYQALSARARQFADYMFSPQSAARATRSIYTALLARDR